MVASSQVTIAPNATLSHCETSPISSGRTSRSGRGVSDNPAKFRDQFRRRVERGQCFAQPYLGCREFTAAFGPVEGTEQAHSGSMVLGRMLYDLAFASGGSGEAIPHFFHAALDDGVMRLPLWEEVMHVT